MMSTIIASLYYGAICFLAGMLFAVAWWDQKPEREFPDHTAPDMDLYRETFRSRRRGHGF